MLPGKYWTLPDVCYLGKHSVQMGLLLSFVLGSNVRFFVLLGMCSIGLVADSRVAGGVRKQSAGGFNLVCWWNEGEVR